MGLRHFPWKGFRKPFFFFFFFFFFILFFFCSFSCCPFKNYNCSLKCVGEECESGETIESFGDSPSSTTFNEQAVYCNANQECFSFKTTGAPLITNLPNGSDLSAGGYACVGKSGKFRGLLGVMSGFFWGQEITPVVYNLTATYNWYFAQK